MRADLGDSSGHCLGLERRQRDRWGRGNSRIRVEAWKKQRPASALCQPPQSYLTRWGGEGRNSDSCWVSLTHHVDTDLGNALFYSS